MVRKYLSKLNYRNSNRMILIFGALLLINLALLLLNQWGHIPFTPQLVSIAQRIAVIIGTYFVASLFIRISLPSVRAIIETEDQPEQAILLSKLYSVGVYFFATMVVLFQFGVNLENIALTIGLFATGFALAIRDIIMSYLSWFILLTKRPFRIGDVVRIGDDTGKVLHIGTFYVLMDETPDRKDDYVRIPTRLFLERPIRNFGRDRVIEKVRVKFVKVPANIDSRLRTLEKSLSDIFAKVKLDTENEHWVVSVEFECAYTERTSLRDRVVRGVRKVM